MKTSGNQNSKIFLNALLANKLIFNKCSFNLKIQSSFSHLLLAQNVKNISFFKSQILESAWNAGIFLETKQFTLIQIINCRISNNTFYNSLGKPKFLFELIGRLSIENLIVEKNYLQQSGFFNISSSENLGEGSLEVISSVFEQNTGGWSSTPLFLSASKKNLQVWNKYIFLII